MSALLAVYPLPDYSRARTLPATMSLKMSLMVLELPSDSARVVVRAMLVHSGVLFLLRFYLLIIIIILLLLPIILRARVTNDAV